MRSLLVVVLALLALAGVAPAASAQDAGPDAGLNEFFFHGPRNAPAGITSAPPATGGPGQTQTGTPPANAESPGNPLAISWRGTEETGIAAGKEVVFRWYFSSPNAGGLLIGVAVDIRLLAVDGMNTARVIGTVDEADLLVGAQPTINETVVPATGSVGAGERLFVQVVPSFIDTGPGLLSNYDSTDFASGFSVREPLPTAGSANPGVDGLPAADAQGLEFSATVPADAQRDESEPNIEIDGDGNIYTCGPTGVSNGAEYAQVSTDGGNQFHLLGEPPRGQQGPGGGGDCGFATSPVRNAGGAFNYAYSGLGPLTNFATAASADNGRSLTGAQTAGVPGVDRQWHTFTDENSVLLSYNQQAPRQVVVQRSDDGGVNYDPAARQATSTNPSFPGPMHSLPASQNPDGAAAGRVPYFGWNRDDQIFLAVSFDEGDNWHNCKIAKAPGEPGLFVTVDEDRDGNIYVVYSERTTFHTYMSVLPIGKLGSCRGAGSLVAQGPGVQTQSTTVQAEVNPPVQVDRERIRTSLFSWVTAGGAPGRVAVTFYGSETDGDPNVGPGTDEDGKPTGFRGSWDVYVNQSLNALAGDATFSQVKATTHPFHYDSICLNGLGCSITGGDRSLADFFAMDFSPKRHALSVVYNQGYKRPDDEAGDIATPAVVNQIAGPTLDGTPIDAAQGPALANSRPDPDGDALADYSRLCPPSCTAKPNSGKPEPGADLRSIAVGPQADPQTGAAVAGGGFNVTMKVSDLRTEALDDAVSDQRSTSLLYVFRWINGFRSAAAVARYTPGDGFRFGFNDYVTGSVSCGGTGSKCLTYPGDQEIPGKVDAEAGTITMSVPRAKLRGLTGSTGADQRPQEVPAGDGSRFYDGTAFVLAAALSADTSEQSFLYPYDNAPSFDFLTAGALTPPSGGGSGAGTESNRSSLTPLTPRPGGPGGSGGSQGATGCTASTGFRSVSASRSGRSAVNLTFDRRTSAPVTVDVFRVSAGRRVLGERLVARFTNRSRSFRWNGVANRGARRQVGTGYYFVRYTMLRGGRRFDVRRVVLRRSGGRFSRRPDFFRRATCDLLSTFKLERPVFGGPRLTTLKASYRLTRAARVTVTITKGSKVVRRYRTVSRAGRRTFRITLPARRRARGDYRVRLRATAGGESVNTTLVARRL